MRDARCNKAYWAQWVNFQFENIRKRTEESQKPAGDTSYAPQYLFNLAREHWHLMFYRYSRGDPIGELAQHFPALLDAWEDSERLGKEVWTEQQRYTRHAWAVNMNHYIACFWLVGLALTLKIPNHDWQRLLALVGNEGEDELLDRVIASRQPNRKIGTKLCHPMPYRRLLDAVNAVKDKQAQLLFAFVDKWYVELNRPAKYDRPYWYNYHDPMGGTYFGYWCVEAVGAVEAFGLNDSLCLGHPNYPGDLLRPDGPTTHSEGAIA